MPNITRTITGGSLFVIRAGVPDFNFDAKNLAVAFLLGDAGGLPSSAGPFAAGDLVNISGTLAGEQTLNVGPVDLAGVSYASLFFTGTLDFTADGLTIPANGPTPLQLSTPFKLGGFLDAFHNNPFIGPPGPAVFHAKLKGHGTAVLRCSASNTGGGVTFRELSSLFYGFDS